jgi:hypothetical protein
LARLLDAHMNATTVAVLAIAVEAVVKLCALLCGIFCGLSGRRGRRPVRFDRRRRKSQWAEPKPLDRSIFVPGAAFRLPAAMFQVLVVENSGRTQSSAPQAGAFPTPDVDESVCAHRGGWPSDARGRKPDLFVVTVPISEGRQGLAILALWVSSATSMVISSAGTSHNGESNHASY